MKNKLWALLICASLLSVELRIPVALAADSPTSTATNSTESQQTAQNNSQAINSSGAKQATTLGTLTIAAGMMMIATGAAMMNNPTTASAGAAMMAGGAAMVVSGMQALNGARQMNRMANTAGDNSKGLDTVNPSASTIAGTSLDPNGGSGGQVLIDPSLLRSGKADAIMNDLEAKTGITRDELAKALENGKNPTDLLANSSALSGKIGSEDDLNKLIADASKGAVPGKQEVMDKLGLTNDDLGGNLVNASGGRSLASANGSSDGFGSSSGGGTGSIGINGSVNGDKSKLSPEIQAALDKNGITSLTIFQMVHSQYTKKAPGLFGVPDKQDKTAENPFGNLE